MNEIDSTKQRPTIMEELFAIDLRSLALLRIALALIVLYFVMGQFASLRELYTDDGILPRDLNREYLPDGYWSLYWLSGSFSSAQTIMVMTVLAAGALLVGLKTRMATVVCLVLVWSLQVRNPLVLTAGDILLRMLLFWSVFLPIGKIWSLDSRGDDRPSRWNVMSVATMAIMFQVAFMYFFSGIEKWNQFWLSGNAIEYSMHLDMYVKPLGQWLRQYPQVLKVATFVTLLAEVVGPLVLFAPRITAFSRGFLMGVFWLMHIGIWLTMSIGVFSATAICAWLVFIPSEQWNAMLGEPVGYRDGAKSSRKRQFVFYATQTVAGIFLAYITLLNFANIGRVSTNEPTMLEKFGHTTMTIQKFHMFDEPPVYSPWFEYPADLNNGDRVDLFDIRHRSLGSRPASVYTYMKNQNWRRIHSNLITDPELVSPDLESVCQRIRDRMLSNAVASWNAKYPERTVTKASIDCYLDPIQLQVPDIVEHPDKLFRWSSYELNVE